jgi:hypothetical protein
MHGIIAMAGLAEAAELYVLRILSGVLLVVAGLFALGCWKRWLAAAVIGCLICLLVGLLLEPWHLFAPPTTGDPDEAEWLVTWRTFFVFWLTILLAGVACLRFIIRNRKSRSDARNAA